LLAKPSASPRTFRFYAEKESNSQSRQEDSEDCPQENCPQDGQENRSPQGEKEHHESDQEGGQQESSQEKGHQEGTKKSSQEKVRKEKAVKKAAKKTTRKTAKKAVTSKKKSAKKAPARKATAKKVSRARKGAKPARNAPRFPIKGATPAFPIGGPLKKKTKTKARKLTPVFLEKQKQKLIELRDHILDQMQGVAQDSLRSNGDSSGGSAFGMHQADAGSDAYEKDFALSLLSQEQDALYEVEEAIGRIDNKTYGVCEMSGESIPKARLEAIPFARFTVECQQQVEKSQRGRSRWDSSPQFMKSTDNFFDESDDSDDDNRPKNKD
jgi:DnaK suppressor protein